MNHDYETGVDLSDSVNIQNLCETPPSGEITMTSYPTCNKTSSSPKPCIPDKKLRTMERYQEVVLAFSEFVMKKVCAVPPGGGLTMTSYPACNKTSLSRKHALQIKGYYMDYYHEL